MEFSFITVSPGAYVAPFCTSALLPIQKSSIYQHSIIDRVRSRPPISRVLRLSWLLSFHAFFSMHHSSLPLLFVPSILLILFHPRLLIHPSDRTPNQLNKTENDEKVFLVALVSKRGSIPLPSAFFFLHNLLGREQPCIFIDCVTAAYITCIPLPSSLIQFAQCPKNRLSEKPITVLPTLHRAVDSGASSHVTGMLDDDRNSNKQKLLVLFCAGWPILLGTLLSRCRWKRVEFPNPVYS